MVHFILSEFETRWNIYRHDTTVTPVAAGVSTEEEAIALAKSIAVCERPSSIVRIDHSGSTRILFEFPLEVT